MKKLLFALILVCIIALAVGYYFYNKQSTGIENIKADVSIDATTLFSAYESDELMSNNKYLGKVIEVKGVVQKINTAEDNNKSIILETNNEMFGVICNLDSLHSRKIHAKMGKKIKLKGVCTGMLMDVILIKCIEEE
jgi:hypothetical protein